MPVHNLEFGQIDDDLPQAESGGNVLSARLFATLQGLDTMLVLTRKLMEKLYIGADVCVTVVRLEGGQVRLGIEAPREISVVRAELIDGKPADPPTTVAADWPTIVPTPKSAPLRIRSAEARGIDTRHPEPSR